MALPSPIRLPPSPPERRPGLDLLQPEALSKINRLELVAHQVMDGYVQGLHRSSHLGFAVDFLQHRQYSPGDDIKRIDWRLYAKADRYYIKQYEVTTNLRAQIIFDCSGSMAYQGRNEPLSKFRYGQFVAACLAYLILHQQDSAGLITVANDVCEFIPPRPTPAHLMNILAALERVRPAESSRLAPHLHRIAEQLVHRSMVILISDLFEKTEDFIQALHHFRHRRHEVILLQVMADDELTFPFRQWTLFKNMEAKTHRVQLDPALIRRQYLQSVAAHLAAIRKAAGTLCISHLLLNTTRPFDEALTAYLAYRMQTHRL